ncbi:hypothetical protein BC941DRAFT_64469 [Chlamydoabsidia padenii]|nr:hypothetical protein BC941DRAFT_64469 [Chlamydoabsidia padenii]
MDNDDKNHQPTIKKESSSQSQSPSESNELQEDTEPMTLDAPHSTVSMTEDEEMQIAEALQEESIQQSEENIKTDHMELDAEEPVSEIEASVGTNKLEAETTTNDIDNGNQSALDSASLEPAQKMAGDSEEEGEVLSPLPTTESTVPAPSSSSSSSSSSIPTTSTSLPDEALEDGEIADSPQQS